MAPRHHPALLVTRERREEHVRHDLLAWRPWRRRTVNHAKTLRLLLGDAVSSVTIGFAVTPAVLIIDKAVTEACSGAASSVGASIMASSAALVKNPVGFVASPSFVVMWAAFGATYVAANVLDTMNAPALAVLLGATATNMAACVVKDAAFARMFGVGVPKAMPLATVGLFAVRDAATMAMVFTVPKCVSKLLQEQLDAPKALADNAAQIGCPMTIQLASTCLHLTGLDLYNRPTLASGAAISLASRATFIRSQYGAAVGARAFRVLPAYGIGGIGNRMVRRRWRQVDQRDVPGGETPQPRPVYFAGAALNFTEFNLQRMINTEVRAIFNGRRKSR